MDFQLAFKDFIIKVNNTDFHLSIKAEKVQYRFYLSRMRLKDDLRLCELLLSSVMLRTKLKNFPQLLVQTLRFSLSAYGIKQIRGDYMYVLDDRHKELEYMREVETEDGRRGIVLKIEDPSLAYIGMYEQIPRENEKTLSLAKKCIPWQTTVLQAKKRVVQEKNPGILNVNCQNIYSHQSTLIPSVHSDRRSLLALTPLLDVCQDLSYGNMFNFTGCLGSRKTTTLSKIISNFSAKEKHISFYFNPTAFPEVQKVVRQSNGWGISSGKMKKQNQSDVSIYMMGLKVVQLAKLLSKQNWNVLIGLDNFKSVLQAEWHMLQLLSSPNARRSNDFVHVASPKISSVSILNEIYANCGDFTQDKLNRQKSSGSLTAIISTDGNSDQLMPEITPYSNNLKHLASLANKIEFPLNLKHNFKVSSQNNHNKQTLQSCIGILRRYINDYIREKKQSQLKRKLYKNDMVEAPWDYYSLLDADWWLNGLQNYKPQNQADLFIFLRWLVDNIEMELVSHWKIKCVQAFTHYKRYLQQKAGDGTMQEFTQWARIQGYFSPFKKDYLS